MTIDEFLEKLRETPRDWRLNGRIRMWSGPLKYNRCPLEAVSGVLGIYMSAATLRMSEADAIAIASAADHIEPSPLRRRLLEACGLEEAKC